MEPGEGSPAPATRETPLSPGESPADGSTAGAAEKSGQTEFTGKSSQAEPIGEPEGDPSDPGVDGDSDADDIGEPTKTAKDPSAAEEATSRVGKNETPRDPAADESDLQIQIPQDELESGETRSVDSVDEGYFLGVQMVAKAFNSGAFDANDELKQKIINSLAIIKQAEGTKALGDATLFNDTDRERHGLQAGEFKVIQDEEPTDEIQNMRDAVDPIWKGLKEIAKGDGENTQKAQALIKELGQYVKMNENAEVIGFDRIAKEWDDFGGEFRNLQEGTTDEKELEACFHGVRGMWTALLAQDGQVKMKWMKKKLLPKWLNLREKATTGQVFTDHKTRKMVVELLGDFLVADATKDPQIRMLRRSSALKQSGFMFNKLHPVIGNHVSPEDYKALNSSTQMLQNLDTAIRQARIPERLTQLLENYAPDAYLQRWKQLAATGNIGELRPELEQVADSNPTIKNWLEKASAVDDKAIEGQLDGFVNDEHKKIMKEIWKKRRKSLLFFLFITAMVGTPALIAQAEEGQGRRGH